MVSINADTRRKASDIYAELYPSEKQILDL